MKRLSHIILSISLLVLFMLFVVSCGPKKAEIETLRVAAKSFQPTMMNLGNILKEADVAAAKDTLILLTEKFAAIKAAEVPARLAENTEKIQSQVDALSASLNELTTAIMLPELTEIDSTIIKKFDALRTNFSRLGGSLKVKIPELVAFHDVLHTVWHDYYPNDQIDSIKAIVPQFQEKAAALNSIQWPAVLAGETEQLNQKIKELQQAVDELEAICQGDDVEAIKKATSAMHDAYRNINRML